NDMSSLFKELELPLAQILAEIEHTGVLVDTERLKDMGNDLKKRIEDIESEVHSLAGEKFNVNSPKQLAHILFEKLELPVIKKKTRTTIDKKNKERLFDCILRVREIGNRA